MDVYCVQDEIPHDCTYLRPVPSMLGGLGHPVVVDMGQKQAERYGRGPFLGVACGSRPAKGDHPADHLLFRSVPQGLFLWPP